MLTCAEFLAEFGDYLEDAVRPEVRATLRRVPKSFRTATALPYSVRGVHASSSGDQSSGSGRDVE